MTVKRLIIATCEAGGTNAFSIFRDENEQPLVFDYDIITLGIANAVQSTCKTRLTPLKESPLFTSKIDLLAYKDSAFNTLATLKSPQGKNKDVIINTLFPYWQNNRLEANNLIYTEKKIKPKQFL